MQDSPQLKQLHQSIVDSFDMEGLKDLCVLHLNIHFDELGRGGWSETVRELLLYVGRNGRFPDLLRTLAEHRPHISWPDPAQLPIAAWALDPFRRRDFYQHINLPPYYVPRPELLDQLRQALLTDPNDMALVSGVQMNALHGMGGIGKSVMARALCEDSAVQAAFPDGILWATVGQQPDLIPRLREWVEQLGGSITQNAPTVDQLKVALTNLLADRACLLIADDVWKRDHAAVFQVGGLRCRLLLTTRNAAIANQLGATLQPVPEMTPDEAVYLLKQWGQGKLEKPDNALLQAIVARLKYLPLAIKLAGSQLQWKAAQTWLDAFDVLKLRHRRPETAHDSLQLTFGLSLDVLDKTDRQLYAALSIFKEDEPTPLAGVQKLWQGLGGLDNDETVELLMYLADRALLEWRSPQQTILLHDLLREMMAAELGEEGHLAAHRALLDTYRQTKTGAGWATAPDDGYLYNHLVYHLDKLAEADEQTFTELHSLFADDAWLNARVPADGYRYDGFLADLLTTWQRTHTQAEKQITANQPFNALAHCIHYALIHTTINSIVASYEPALVARAVQIGLWQPQRALSTVQRLSDPVRKSHILLDLLDVAVAQFTSAELTSTRLTAIQSSREIMDEEKRAKVLGRLASHLDEELMTQAWQVVRQIQDERWRAKVLGQLAPHLNEELLADVLQAAIQIRDEGLRAEVVGRLIPYLSAKLLAGALQVVRQIHNQGSMASVLGQLAPYLSEDLLVEVLEIARQIRDERIRVSVLLQLHLSVEQKEIMLSQALQAVGQIKNEGSRAKVLVQLAPQLSGETKEAVLVQALQAVSQIKDEESQIDTLVQLAPQLSGETQKTALTQALQAVVQIEDEGSRASALEQLAPQLSGNLLAQALQVARQIQSEWIRTRVLVQLAPQLGKETREVVLIQTLQASRQIGDERIRARVLGELAPQLSGDLLTQALQAASQIKDEWSRASVLVQLAPQLSGDLLAQALQAASQIKDERSRASVLVQLAPQLSTDLLAPTLQESLQLKDEWRRVEVLEQLVPQLSGDLLARALQAAGQILDKESRARLLGQLASYLSKDLLAEALQAAREIQDESSRAKVWGQLAPYLSKELLNEALQAANHIDHKERMAEVLGQLAPHLTEEQKEIALSQALQATSQMQQKSWVGILEPLAPYLSKKLLDRALQAVKQMRHEWKQAEVLGQIAPYLSKKLLTEALQIARQIRNEENQVRAIEQLASYLSKEQKEIALSQALQATKRIRDEGKQAAALMKLAPQLSPELLAEALQLARKIEYKKKQTEVLEQLTFYLSEEQRENTPSQILQVVEPILDKGKRVEALKQPAPQLSEDLLAQELQRTVFEDIWKLQNQKREVLLNFLAADGLLTAESLNLPPASLEAIARSIMEICNQWRWL